MDADANPWQQVRERFLAALELEGQEREAWLERLRSTSPALWHEVVSLLEAHSGADGVLDRVAADFLAQDSLEPAADRWSGRQIGAYVVIGLLGRGGMGEVYRARRADAQYEKEVAIKIVRSGFETRDILDRFRVERQILASLEHPNIARLLDGGTSSDGLPYLVMELVEGERIDVYCDRERLSVDARLRLFQQVCAAVQFAHQRLVIHRDLKTSNILVTRDGAPKLLDFGVAKLLRSADAATETTLFRPLTPAYASPEQIRGEPLTTASDVFSLGVILFELLTGRSPFAAQARTLEGVAQRAGPAEPRRASGAVPAQPAGSMAADAEAGVEAVAAARGTTPGRLRRELTGDLDAILMKAMRPEPEQRYGSVQQLSEDIGQYLRGAAVLAQRGSWRYRLGKFVRRNKVAVGGVAAAVLALAIGLVLTAHQAHVARIERQRADARFEDTRKLANALIFDVNNAMADTPGNTAARKLLLDRAVQYLDKLSQDAAGDTNLQRELAWGYQKLAAVQGNTTESNVGEISAADRSLHKAIELFEAVYRANPGSMEDGLNVAMSHRLMGASDVYYPGGPPQIARAVEILDQLSAQHPGNNKIELERCHTYDLLSYSQDISGERIKSVTSAREALTLARALQQGDPKQEQFAENIAATTVHLGAQLARTGALESAERTLEEAVQQYAALRQGTRGDTLQLARNAAHAQMLLSRVQSLRGLLAQADANLTEADGTVRHLLQLDPGNSMLMWDVVTLSFEHGRVLALRGREAEALPKIAPALERYAQDHEDDSGPGIGMLKAWTALIHFRAAEYEDALKAADESIAGLNEEPLYADARSGLAADQVLIGEVLTQRHDYSGARAAYERVLSTANVADAITRGDAPALYALADAQAGLGDLLMAQAQEAGEARARSRFVSDACDQYAASEQTWSRIAEPGLYSPDLFPSGSPQSVHARLARCRAARGKSGA